MTYLIIAAALLPIAALVATYFYMEHQARQNDLAETLRFRAMSAVERQQALIQAKRDRAEAYAHRNDMSRLYSGWKWGYRHNPYRTRYSVAQAQYVAANARVQKLRTIIAELDGNPS